MKLFIPANKIHLTLTRLSYLVFFTSLVCCFRAISNISIAAFILIGITTLKKSNYVILKRSPATLLIFGCALFFLFQLISPGYSANSSSTWNKIFLKTGIIFLPAGIYLTNYFDKEAKSKLLFQFCIILFIASSLCLLLACWNYSQTKNSAVFFYHELVSPLSQHAIFYSIYIFIALVFLMENARNKNYFISQVITIGLIIFFSAFLFLLSSKFIISIYLVYLLVHFVLHIILNRKNRLFTIGTLTATAIAASSILIIDNPVSKRFHEISGSSINIIRQNKFDPGDYFDGVQFRLLQWRLVTEILNEKQAWWKGVGPANTQSALDGKYIEKNMYIGDPGKKDHGYLGYNTHNQALESLLSSGIPGLLAFGFICYAIVRMALFNKSRLYWFATLAVLLYSLIESVFETQYGITLFLFFPLFLDSTGRGIYAQNK